ncbi:hypothetical protein ES319_D05G086600v1 [Gossypium barbadense]|uniref:Late embryogenesis abundant protein LEA-2 subgroup domain-containing protein n=1 Tax=Gossypium barbadense TaxID=3634 RepID=A0A5J5RB89_GOSBA|nr:hypothetical protein ES319_D05G086600v1 [Gossypium barbadense]
MAGNTSVAAQQQPRRQFSLVRCVATCLLALIVLVGLAVLIAWAFNRNRRISVYYDYIESTVTYEDQTLAFNTVDPFFQPHRNVSRIKPKLVALNLAMSPSTSKDLMIEKTSKEIQVDVHFKARVRLKVGTWKSNHRTLRIVCYSVTVHLSWYKHFDRVPCEAEL